MRSILIAVVMVMSALVHANTSGAHLEASHMKPATPGRTTPPPELAPAIFESRRIAGETQIVPDDDTKRRIAADRKDKLVSVFKLCIGTTGDVASVSQLKSTGYTAYDTKLLSTMRTWKYVPCVDGGKAVPVCGTVTFIYRQERAKPLTADIAKTPAAPTFNPGASIVSWILEWGRTLVIAIWN